MAQMCRKSSTLGIQPMCQLIRATPQGTASPAIQCKTCIFTQLAGGKSITIG